ncbi:MAG: periplasmic heavy metal sensor [Alphaproteobacteria bacterium]|nr:periplasmic heavy metal sensor [Alphaproteobacteria bacterium]
MNKKVLTALGISLAVNFIFIGFEASRIYHRPAFSHIPPARPSFASKQGPEKFSSPEQKLMRASFKEALKNHAQEMKEAKQAVEEALKKEPFDAEEFKAALQKAAAVRSTVDAAVQENMVEMLSKMSSEERRRFAEQFGKPDKAFKMKKDEKQKDFRPDPERIKPHHKKDFRPRGEHKSEYCKGPRPPKAEEGMMPMKKKGPHHCGCDKNAKHGKEAMMKKPMKDCKGPKDVKGPKKPPMPDKEAVAEAKDAPEAKEAATVQADKKEKAEKKNMAVQKRIRRRAAKSKTPETAAQPVVSAPAAAE